MKNNKFRQSAKQKTGRGVLFFLAPGIHTQFKTLLVSRRQSIQDWGEKMVTRELEKAN